MRRVSERTLILLIGAVQAINILDFMMVMPMGPWFAEGLGFPVSHVAWLGGSYTAAAAVSGIIGSFFLDRYDRRKALAVSLLGLVLGTVAGGFAVDLHTMMAARMAAGAFGGPATAIALSIIADAVPPERRGRAIGAVMSAFSVASVFGVPAGLKLAQLGGWRMPFFAVGAAGLVVTAGAIFLLPPMRAHLDLPVDPTARRSRPWDALTDPLARLALVITGVTFMANFSVVPNIATFLQHNLAYPAERMDVLYGVGGAVSFMVMRLVGRAVDRLGATPVASFGAVLFIAILLTVFVWTPPGVPVLAAFVAFMVAQSFRMVPLNTLTSRVPRAADRAGFLSAQSAVQHVAASIGAFMSSAFLSEGADHHLRGMDLVALVSAALCVLPPFLIVIVQRGVVRREAERRVVPAPAQ
jgi:predicted MFS family arabinose efflux permease